MHPPRYPKPPTDSFDSLVGFRPAFLAGTLGQGGAERQLFYLLKCLKECGADVSLLILTKGEHWEAPIRELEVPIHFVGGNGSRLGRLLHILKTVRRLRPQVVQSQHFFTNIYAGMAGRCLRRASIGAIRNDAASEVKAHVWPLGWLSVKLPHWLAANSANALRNLQHLGFSELRCLFLPNVVDTDRFGPAGHSASESEFTILGIGRLEPQKRFDLFLETISHLLEQSDLPVRAVVAGEGSMRRVLEEMASQKRRSGLKIEFLGNLPDVLPLYHAAGALLLTSDHEGTPNVVMEAMACGLPVVATNVGGVAGLIKNGETGFIFEPNDVPGAVNVLESLVRNPVLAAEMGARARSFIEENHSLSRLPAILAQLYRTILAAQ